MSKEPLVSICLPVFNGEAYLASAIESALGQRQADFELLISDDGSIDGSNDIAMKYAAADSRIRYWKNPHNLGLFANYNACISEARGKYIKPFAQDDLLDADALACMSELLETKPEIALVSSARQIIDRQGALQETKQPMAEDQLLSGRDVITFHLINLNNWVGEPSTVMFRKEHAGTGFNTAYYHYGDIEYWLRILRNGNYYYIHRPLASFRRHGANQTDKNHRELLFALDILRLSLDYRAELSEIESEPLMMKRLSEKIALEQGHVIDAYLPCGELLKDYAGAFLSAEANLESSFPSEENMKRLRTEAAGFRLLASYALNAVSQLTSELDHEKRCRADEHERFVAEVEKMRQSLYWKLSSPLRKMRDAMRGNSTGPRT